MDKKKRFTLDKMTFLLFTIIPLVLYTFFYIISVVSGMYYSLTDWNGLNPTYNFVGISNYIALSKNIFMWRSLGRTLLYALMLVVCITILSLIIALVLNSVKRFKVFTKCPPRSQYRRARRWSRDPSRDSPESPFSRGSLPWRRRPHAGPRRSLSYLS